jgi:hypothetical protein
MRDLVYIVFVGDQRTEDFFHNKPNYLESSYIHAEGNHKKSLGEYLPFP